MNALVFLEWFHRMVVLGLSLAILGLLVLTWRRGLPQRWLAMGVFSVLILQAVLGGLTVLMRLNIWVVALHQAFALIFFGMLVTLTVLLFLSRPAPAEGWEEPVATFGGA
jgi:cytochrome c oxidase assembly protein subunit 15